MNIAYSMDVTSGARAAEIRVIFLQRISRGKLTPRRRNYVFWSHVSLSHVALRAAGGVRVLCGCLLRFALHRTAAGGVVSLRCRAARAAGDAFDGRADHGAGRKGQ